MLVPIQTRGLRGFLGPPRLSAGQARAGWRPGWLCEDVWLESSRSTENGSGEIGLPWGLVTSMWKIVNLVEDGMALRGHLAGDRGSHRDSDLRVSHGRHLAEGLFQDHLAADGVAGKHDWPPRVGEWKEFALSKIVGDIENRIIDYLTDLTLDAVG